MAPRPSQQPVTLWVWPTGLYPGRVMYYLRAKHLPHKVLDNLKLIPVVLDTSVPSLEAVEPNEKRPPGTSLPLLRVHESRFITQSSAVLEYLEDIFPPQDGFVNLKGDNADIRARVQDIVQWINEFLVWLNVNIRHTSEYSLSWSGMTKEEQSVEAGKDAEKQLHKYLQKLESWVEHDIVEGGSLSLAGGSPDGPPTLADFTLAATVPYMKEVYGWDMLKGYPILAMWYQRYSKSRWWLEREDVRKAEVEGFDFLFE